jgi:hypothetical protein
MYLACSKDIHQTPKKHWEAVKRVLRYLIKSIDYLLELGGEMIKIPTNQLEVYGDADFPGDRDELKSTTGFISIKKYGSVIAWKSPKQKIAAKSTGEA